MPAPDILTSRLRLAPITTERMRADAAHSTHFSDLIGAHVPPSWPPEHWEPHVFDFIEKQYAQYPHTIGWNRYVILRSGPILIGTLGAFQRSETDAEIGYSILPPWQCIGFATEATLAHIAFLFENHPLETLTAHTFANLIASIRVMEKCGFQPDGVGDEAGTVRYRLRRPYS
jgi:[ribosomal protein S5]-alanine N-acetyltransferase